jgi:hypothetical protein
METHHLTLRRFALRDGVEQVGWVFRHDRIHDFFVAHALMGRADRQRAFLSDPRLHGAYLMLAMLDSIAAARRLERILIDYAAASRDHALSDDLVNLHNARDPSAGTSVGR